MSHGHLQPTQDISICQDIIGLSQDSDSVDFDVLNTTAKCPVFSQLLYPPKESMRLPLVQVKEDEPCWVWLNECP